MAFTRILALSARYLMVMRRSIPRMLDLFWWQTVAVFVWGFLTIYLNRFAPEGFSFIALLLGGLFFWELFNRSQITVSMSFLEDVWSRNLMNLFVTPLRLWEFLASVILVSFAKTLVALVMMAGLTAIFWHFNVFTFGVYLIPFGALLFIFGWSMGIFTTALILRFGHSAEFLAWSLPVIVQPLSAVFYPIDALPSFLRPVALLFPSTHVFEGMRTVLKTGVFDAGQAFIALALDIAFLVLALLFFQYMFRLARNRGLLVRLATE